MSSTYPDQGPNLDSALKELEIYSILNERAYGLYSHLAKDKPGLEDFASNLADEYTEFFLETASPEHPSVNIQRDLLRKGFLGLTIITSQLDPHTGEFCPPKGTTFFESFKILFQSLDYDIERTVHEWSLLPTMAASLRTKDEEYMYTDPDARLASITISVLENGLSRGILGLDD